MIVTALVLGGGLGVVLGHTGRGGLVAVNAANAFRAVPTLALLTLLAIQPSISLKWNGFLAAWIALTMLAIPPILTNTYVGMREVDADVRDAAKAMGLTGLQVLRGVEAPLAIPFVMAGVRTASIEVVATSTLAAYVSYSDLGTPSSAASTTVTRCRRSPVHCWSPCWPASLRSRLACSPGRSRRLHCAIGRPAVIWSPEWASSHRRCRNGAAVIGVARS